MTGIFFIARLESKRLKQKHLINVGSKCIIEWLYERFLYEFKQEVENGKIKLFITTGNKKVNKGLEKTIKKKKILKYFMEIHKTFLIECFNVQFKIISQK